MKSVLNLALFSHPPFLLSYTGQTSRCYFFNALNETDKSLNFDYTIIANELNLYSTRDLPAFKRFQNSSSDLQRRYSICVNPNGQSVNCNINNNNDPLRYIESNIPGNITVYRLNAQTFNEYISNENDNEFKCCLPSNCFDTTNVITINIFSKLYLIVLVHTLICY